MTRQDMVEEAREIAFRTFEEGNFLAWFFVAMPAYHGMRFGAWLAEGKWY